MTNRHDLQREGAWLSRIYPGQISKLEEENGLMHVVVPALNNEFPVTVPMQSTINSFKSSWDRHMPSVNDFVLIGFGPDNQPEILGYTVWGDYPSSAAGGVYADRKGGYARLAKLNADSVAGRKATAVIRNPDGTETTTPPQSIGLNDFIPLKKGEFDKRSSGGAYIHGSQGGVLTLSAGTAGIKVDKNRGEVRTTAGLATTTSEASYARFGDVKYPLPPNLLSPSKPPDALDLTGASKLAGLPRKEWRVHVAASLAPLVELPVYDFHTGDVRIAPFLTFEPGVVPALPTRKKETIYDAQSGLPTYQVKVDSGGNVLVLAPIAQLIGYTAPFATATLSMLNLTVAATGAMSIVTPAFAVSGGLVALGAAPLPLVLGPQFLVLIAAIAAALGTITTAAPSGGAPAATAITAALAAFQLANGITTTVVAGP